MLKEILSLLSMFPSFLQLYRKSSWKNEIGMTFSFISGHEKEREGDWYPHEEDIVGYTLFPFHYHSMVSFLSGKQTTPVFFSWSVSFMRHWLLTEWERILRHHMISPAVYVDVAKERTLYTLYIALHCIFMFFSLFLPPGKESQKILLPFDYSQTRINRLDLHWDSKSWHQRKRKVFLLSNISFITIQFLSLYFFLSIVVLFLFPCFPCSLKGKRWPQEPSFKSDGWRWLIMRVKMLWFTFFFFFFFRF